MLELLAVLGIYFAVSFIGMAALWTVAVRKGVVRAPSYFFWIHTDESPRLPAACEAGSSNAVSNFLPLGLTAATVILVSAMATSQLAPRSCVGGMGPNQVARPNALIGS